MYFPKKDHLIFLMIFSIIAKLQFTIMIYLTIVGVGVIFIIDTQTEKYFKLNIGFGNINSICNIDDNIIIIAKSVDLRYYNILGEKINIIGSKNIFDANSVDDVCHFNNTLVFKNSYNINMIDLKTKKLTHLNKHKFY
jgi:hypothetical protein